MSAFIIIATLLVALVPSTALAVKPVPVIGNISIVSAGEVSGGCEVDVIVNFDGRAHDAFIQMLKVTPAGPSGVGAFDPPVDNKLGRALTSFTVNDLGSAEYYWTAVLRDRKDKEISVLQRTVGVDSFDGAGCPQYGTPVAHFP